MLILGVVDVESLLVMAASSISVWRWNLREHSSFSFGDSVRTHVIDESIWLSYDSIQTSQSQNGSLWAQQELNGVTLSGEFPATF
jgi:hypothetical protein